MLAEQVRSGQVETIHLGAVAVVDQAGRTVVHTGEIDRPFYFRSAAKPFQAAVSQHHGAGLDSIRLAIACASHGGHPVQVALVEEILRSAGLSNASLRCPPDWPLAQAATLRLAARGHLSPQPAWHNCSGKHAAMLAACVASGWDPERYADLNHPLQKRVSAALEEAAGRVGPEGIDGCGLPVFPTTARRMAAAYARLAFDTHLAEVWSAMHSYPALVSGPGNPDTLIATWTESAAKGGALGCLGVAVRGRFGLAVKCWDGSRAATAVAAIAALDELGVIPEAARPHLSSVAKPVVFGGGKPVGNIESRLELRWG
jgi:L-asparaginase II